MECCCVDFLPREGLLLVYLVGMKIFCSSLITSSSVPFLPYFPVSSDLGGGDVEEKVRKKRGNSGWREKKQCQFMWLIFNPWIVYLTHVIHLY